MTKRKQVRTQSAARKYKNDDGDNNNAAAAADEDDDEDDDDVQTSVLTMATVGVQHKDSACRQTPLRTLRVSVTANPAGSDPRVRKVGLHPST